MSLEAEMQKMYDSELHVSISWVWDGAIDVRLGNCEVCGTMQTTDEILPWLQRMIAVHYPNSKYNVERMGGTFNPKIPPRAITSRAAASRCKLTLLSLR
jgi:hypothetical protein